MAAKTTRREATEKKVAELESELGRAEGRWRRKLKIKDNEIERLRALRTEQATELERLRSDSFRLQENANHLEVAISEREDHLQQLGVEVEAERRRRREAQESSWADRAAVHNLRRELDEERSSYRVSREVIDALEARLAFLDSEQYKAKVVEKFRHSPLGKVEVALACKAGFDFLISRLPRESRPAPGSLYPSQVSCCLDLLKELEVRGGGVTLEVEDGGDEEESSDGQGEVGPSAVITVARSAPTPAPDASSTQATPDSRQIT